MVWRTRLLKPSSDGPAGSRSPPAPVRSRSGTGQQQHRLWLHQPVFPVPIRRDAEQRPWPGLGRARLSLAAPTGGGLVGIGPGSTAEIYFVDFDDATQRVVAGQPDRGDTLVGLQDEPQGQQQGAAAIAAQCNATGSTSATPLYQAKGQPLANAPKVSCTLGANYRRDVLDDLLFDMNVNYAWRDKTFNAVGNPDTKHPA